MSSKPSSAPGRKRRRPKSPPLVIGWREVVALPDLGLADVRAKIDTGARTSALHATHIRPEERDGVPWVRFRPPPLGHPRPRVCAAPVHDRREVRNTSGVRELRWVIRTHLHIADRNFLIELSLADRADMTYPIIIGRTAIRYHRLLVDSGRSWLTRPAQLDPAPGGPAPKARRQT